MDINFDPYSGMLCFQHNYQAAIKINNAGFSYAYKIGHKNHIESSMDLIFSQTKKEVIIDNQLGEGLHEIFLAKSTQSKAEFTLELFHSHRKNFTFWRLAIENADDFPYQISEFCLLEEARHQTDGICFLGRQEDLRFFSQGWQSWSHTASYGIQDRMITSNLSVAQAPLCYDHGTPRSRRKGCFSSDYFTILSNVVRKTGLLLGFVSQKEQFGSISVDLHNLQTLKLWAKADDAVLHPGQSMQTDWAVCQDILLHDDPLAGFTNLVRDFHGVQYAPATYAGWCSWYYYYQNISDSIIRENFQQIESLKETIPLDLVQIDDGYEKQVGDWLKFAPTFPDGVVSLADDIKASGLMPGLWMAPFIVHPNSDLMKEHPDWILRNRFGLPVNAGFIWNVFTTALDLTHPEALNYALDVIRTAAQEWHFPYLKLDFLYAAALPGKHHDPTLTRAQILRSAFEQLREVVGPEVYLLGCGAPMGPSIGIFNAMRIGADVCGSWNPKYFGMAWPFLGEPNMPSARNAIQNVMTRQSMHRKWWINDPDCLLVRADSELTYEEVKTLTSVIGLSGGAFLVSDNMPALSADRLALIQKVMPIHKFDVHIPDLLIHVMPEMVLVHCQTLQEEWKVLGRFHWGDHAKEVTFSLKDYGITEGSYWLRSFWDDKVTQADTNQEVTFDLIAHGCLVLAVRKVREDHVMYLGSSFHLLQGMELTQQEETPVNVVFKLDLHQQMIGWVDVYMPRRLSSVWVDQKQVACEELLDKVIRIPVTGNGKVTIQCVYE
jgi:alpha-galactosidase